MTDEKIKELRDKFYKDCVATNNIGLKYMDKSPMDTFQWIVDNVIKAKKEATGEPGVDRGGGGLLSELRKKKNMAQWRIYLYLFLLIN